MQTQLQNCIPTDARKPGSALKKVFLLLFAAIIGGLPLSAQIKVPNSSFETGSGNIPTSWSISNDVSRLTSYSASINGGKITISPADGKYFMKLRTDSPATGSTDARLGSISITLGNVGLPDSFTFDRMYFPKIADDNYSIDVTMLKFDSTTHQVNHVYSTGTSGSNANTSWQRESSPLDYFGTTPVYDSLKIVIRSANPSQHDPNTLQGRWGIGATLLIDNFKLISNSATGIKETKVPFGLASTVYPNPATGPMSISFSLDRSCPVKLQVFDVQGRIVNEQEAGVLPAGNNALHISAGQLAPGEYMYLITTADKSGAGRFIVNP